MYALPYWSLIFALFLIKRETAIIFHKAIVGNSVVNPLMCCESLVLSCCYLLFALCAAQFLVCALPLAVTILKSFFSYLSDQYHAKYSKYLL